jgi:ferredoxin
MFACVRVIVVCVCVYCGVCVLTCAAWQKGDMKLAVAAAEQPRGQAATHFLHSLWRTTRLLGVTQGTYKLLDRHGLLVGEEITLGCQAARVDENVCIGCGQQQKQEGQGMSYGVAQGQISGGLHG